LKKLASIVLLLVFASIGSGALQYAHLLDHLHHDHEADQTTSNQPAHHHEDHDESHCAICGVLHMPTVSAGYVPILISLGILVAFLTEIAAVSSGYRLLAWIDCRGPPCIR
jgi:ABC-type nickel/cobalt efflux system permease component RcnA